MSLTLTEYTLNPGIKTKNDYFLLTATNKLTPTVPFEAVCVIRRNQNGQITFRAAEGQSKEEIIKGTLIPQSFAPIGAGVIVFTGTKFVVAGQFVEEVSLILKKAYPEIPVE